MSLREDFIKLETARVASIELALSEQSTWHYHSQAIETVFCLQGVIEVETKRRNTRKTLKG